MTLLSVLRVLPEVIELVSILIRQMEVRGDSEHFNKEEELKKSLKRISKAIEDGDEKTLNDIINSL